MAIFDRSYQNFAGERTPTWSRGLVIARYALEDAFSSRLFLIFFLACLLWPLACGVMVYLRYNTEALAMFDIELADLFRIDAGTFRDFFMEPQSQVAFALVLVLAPGLISPDLRNNAMPLYLARPLDRTDYIAGKLAVLVTTISAVTWIPGGLLFLFQAGLAGDGWWRENFRALVGMVAGFWLWMLALSLLGLALSALVKWKPLARILLFGLVAVAAGMGNSFNQIYGTWQGSVLDLNEVRGSVYDHLLGLPGGDLPSWAAWLAIVVLTLASTWLLRRRIRAYEVVA
jgi:ABC-type transport system involved in multi-copper enzyme maturation permease subunit